MDLPAVVSLSSAVITLMKGAYLEEILETCVLGRPGSIPGQVVLDLWFSPSTSIYSTSSHFTNCSIFINHPVIDAV
jgi:hypothetical protein